MKTAVVIGAYVVVRVLFPRKAESMQQRFDPNSYIPQEQRVFRPDEESKIVEEWNQFQQDRMKPYYEAMSRGEITDGQVYQALLECPSFRVWLKKHHPDAFNWMKHIPE